MSYLIRAMSALSLIVTASVASAQLAEFEPGEVLVKFRSTNRPGLTENTAIQAKLTRNIARLNVQRIKLPAGMSTMDGISYYRSLATVEYAEPNFKKKMFFTPNDPRFNQQWGPKKVQCEAAWDITKGAATVIIAIIDSGIDLNHEDLKDKLVPGYDFGDDDNDPTFLEDHGVHVAGIAAADTNNAKGVVGSGFNCKIMPLKLSPQLNTATSAEAITYAADKGAKVLNMSYGSAGETTTELNAVNYAWGKGCVLVAASGNDGVTTKSYPAAFPNVIAVGNSQPTDRLDPSSNFGADWVDVAAPGEGILSTIPGGYGLKSGTSMASPLVAGVVGLLWSVAPAGTTNLQIRNALESTTDPIVNNTNQVKFGRINAFKAVKVFDNNIPTVVSPANAVFHWFGTNPTGTLADIQTSDARYFQTTTVDDPLGQVAGITVGITYNGTPTNLRLAQVIVEANGTAGATNQVYLWNYTTSKYDLIRAAALTPTGTNQQKVALPLDLTKYSSGANMKVGFRAIGPKRLPISQFDFKVNLVRVETKAKS